MKQLVLISLVLIIGISSIAQNTEKKKSDFGIKFSGFIKTDVFYDTRAIVAPREGHFNLWPAQEKLDANGDDINAVPSFNMLSIQSRINASIKGPEAFGAKTSGFIEADFFGTTDANINTLRLRHAFVKLNWTNSELMLGQYWNPLFQGKCYPTTIAFSSGAGIMPFARNPQIRYTYKKENFSTILTAYSERDHVSSGIKYEDGIAKTDNSSKYIRNSSIPALNAQIHYSFKINDAKFNTGVGANMLTVRPQDITSAGYVTSQNLTSYSSLVFLTANFKPFTFKISAVVGENMVNTISFGGFAILDTINLITNEVNYTPVRNGILWADINTNGKKVQFGLLAGINRNLGTRDEINVNTSFYGRMPYIKNVTRISPRVVFIAGKTRFGAELEISGAEYGEGTYDKKGIPQNTKRYTNYRFMLSATYLF